MTGVTPLSSSFVAGDSLRMIGRARPATNRAAMTAREGMITVAAIAAHTTRYKTLPPTHFRFLLCAFTRA
jgi:hypothetical protein